VSDEFRLDVRDGEGRQWVTVHGELDLATAPTLEDAFARRVVGGSDGGPGCRPVVVDLTACEFIDSTGVRTLVQQGQRALAAGRRISILCPPSSGSRFTLDLLGVEASIPVIDSVDHPALGGDPAGTS
jgi:anti-anti-sigma factor